MKYFLLAIAILFLTVAIPMWLISINTTENLVKDYKIMCIKDYNYIVVRGNSKLAITPLIINNNFVECGNEIR